MRKKKLCLVVSFLLTFTALMVMANQTGYYENLAIGKPVTVSALYDPQYPGENVNDGDDTTLWGSGTEANYQWMYIDLGAQTTLDGFKVDWYNNYYAISYEIGISDDADNWTPVVTQTAGAGGIEEYFTTQTCRYVGIGMYTKNKDAYGIEEFEILKWVVPTPTPVYTFEAEDANISGHASIADSATCSGGKKVVGIVGVADVEFVVDVPTTGPYVMQINYLSGMITELDMSINSGPAEKVIFNSTGSWETIGIKEISLTLNAGVSSIKFSTTAPQGPDIDKIDLVENIYNITASATVISNLIDVSWQLTDPGAQADEFEVKYYKTGQAPAVILTHGPTHAITNLHHGATYTISVRVAGSIWSDEVTVTIDEAPNYQVWNSTTNYAIDTLVSHENKIWRAKTGNIGQEPALTNTWKIEKEIVKIITAKSVYDQIKPALDQYEADVEANFAADIEMIPGSFNNEEELRTLIQGIYNNGFLSGVILVGNFPALRHQKIFGTGERKQFSLPLYFMDLDNDFIDKDGDGYTEVHPWEGDENTVKIESEIWVSIIQPAIDNEVAELNAFFQKTHTYYLNQTPYPKSVLVTGQAEGYSGNIEANTTYYTGLNYFDTIDKLGGFENNQHIYVYKEEYLNQLKANTYLLNHVSTHASANGQAFCDPQPADNVLYAGRLTEIPAGYGALITLIWGCNTGDYGIEKYNNTALRYVLADHIGQVSVANARSIGINKPEEMITNMINNDITLAQAFYQWHLAIMNPAYARLCFGPDMEPRLDEFVWANCLFGNPFIKIPQ